jgi:hypothetical protein
MSANAIPDVMKEVAKAMLAGALDTLQWAQQQEATTVAAYAGVSVAAYVAFTVLTAERVPRVDVALTAEERAGVPGKKWVPGRGSHSLT